MAEHSGLPWRVGSGAIVWRTYFDDVKNRIHQPIANCDGHEPNASYIVRACNSFPELVKALGDLIGALDVCHMDERYKSVWAINQICSGNPYSGPTYVKEFDAARAALSRANGEG